jgi:hypothetical protein
MVPFPVLCSKLIEMSYTDLAELNPIAFSSLPDPHIILYNVSLSQTLENISEEFQRLSWTASEILTQQL